MRALVALSLKTLASGSDGVALNQTVIGHFAEPAAGLLLTVGLSRQAALAFKAMTSPEDLLLLRLPGPLQFLYPVLRVPVWIGKTLRRHGRRGHDRAKTA